jgi:hypothetical protein
MTKKEILWREILYQAIENKKIEWTQKELANQFGFSLSTVFNALKIPRQTGAIKVAARNFTVIDKEKFLYLWATQRNMGKEIIYQTNVSNNPREIEGSMPEGIIFACYSAYTKKYQDAPADYDKVYVYAGPVQLTEIKKRFPFQKGYPNLIILKSDPYLETFGSITPDAQTFVDLWNLKDWYAKEFLNGLKQKIL